MRYVVLPSERYDAYYNEIANRILWFAHHYLWDIAAQPDASTSDRARHGRHYVEANRAFAQALATEATDDPVYLIQDYQLCAGARDAPRAGPEREDRPLLPHAVRRSHLPADPARRDAHGARSRHGGGRRPRVPVEAVGRKLPAVGSRAAEDCTSTPRRDRIGGRRARWRRCASFPVAVSAQPIREAAGADRAPSAPRARSRAIRGDRKLLLRVDRMEPSKNILRGFLAFGLLLRRIRNGAARWSFLCLLSPSREEVPEYQSYGDDCLGDRRPGQRGVRDEDLDADRAQGAGGLRRTPSPRTTSTTSCS